MRTIKVKAAQEDRRLKDVIADLLEQALAHENGQSAKPGYRVKLPLIETAHPAAPGEELTPERVAQILIDQEVERYGR